jgi:hypothetical protein
MDEAPARRQFRARGRRAAATIVGVVAALLVPAATAQAQAAPTYEIAPTSGPIGTILHVTGTGCPPTAGSDLTFTVVNGPGRSQLFESAPDGSFSFDYPVPPARAGDQNDESTYETSLFCLSSGVSVTGPSFTITGPIYSVVPASAPAGATVTVSGLGCFHDDNAATDGTFVFAAGQPPVAFDSAVDHTFSFQAVVPALPPGDYVTQVTCLSRALQSPAGPGGVQLSGTAPFTIEGATPSPVPAMIGDLLDNTLAALDLPALSPALRDALERALQAEIDRNRPRVCTALRVYELVVAFAPRRAFTAQEKAALIGESRAIRATLDCG